MAFNFYAHCDLAFGEGSVSTLSGMLLKDNIKKLMIFHGKSTKKVGIADEVIAEAKKVEGIEITVFDKVSPDPTNELVEEAAKIAKEKEIEGFVAVGGGSAIDLAKAVNVLMTNPGKIGEYGGPGLVKNPVLPLIAIPTTAGTSTEVTAVSALNDTVNLCKYVVIDTNIIPSHVIADPAYTKSMPTMVTATTGMDAITHAVESYISNLASPLTKIHSIEGLKIFYENLPKAVENGEDMEARSNMMLGCIVVGFGFSNANLGLVHGIAHVLSAYFHLSHGLANALVLPYVMEYNAPCCKNEMIEMAKAINLPLEGTEEDIYALSKALLDLSKKVGITTLGDHGVKESDLEKLAEETLKEPVLGFNPRQNITKEEIISILNKAL